MILQVEADKTGSEIEVRNSYSEFYLLCYSFLLTYLLCLKGKRGSIPIEHTRFWHVWEKTEKKIMPKFIFPLLCMMSTLQTSKSVHDGSCVKWAIMPQMN